MEIKLNEKLYDCMEVLKINNYQDIFLIRQQNLQGNKRRKEKRKKLKIPKRLKNLNRI